MTMMSKFYLLPVMEFKSFDEMRFDLEDLSLDAIPPWGYEFLYNQYRLEKWESLTKSKEKAIVKKISWEEIYITMSWEDIWLLEYHQNQLIWYWLISPNINWFPSVLDTCTLENYWKYGFFWKRRLEIMNALCTNLLTWVLHSAWNYATSSARSKRDTLVKEWKAKEIQIIFDQGSERTWYEFIW